MKIYNLRTPTPPANERIISVLSYLTMGLVGFIWLIIVTIQRAQFTRFLKYHIMQSIFLSVIVYILGIVIQIILNIVGIVPIVGQFILTGAALLGMEIFNGVSIIQLAMGAIVLYLGIGALLGKYSYFPWVSDNIKQML